MAELRYRRPSRDWLDRLPLGNGRLGVMVGADEASIRLGLNEATAWSGSPASALRDLVEPDVAASALAGARAALAADRPLDAEEALRPLQHGYSQSFLPVGELAVTFSEPFDGVTRTLDLHDGVHRCELTAPGRAVSGEAAVGAADDAVLLALRAATPFTVRVDLGTGLRVERAAVDVAGGAWVLRLPADAAPPHEPDVASPVWDLPGETPVGLAVRLAVAHDGAADVDGDAVVVAGATVVRIALAIESTFVAADRAPSDAAIAVERAAARLEGLDVDAALATHVEAHRLRAGAFAVDLGDEATGLDPDQRYRAADANGGLVAGDPALLALLVEYGRYLLLASSRPDGPPATLQGIWNAELRPPWSSNYTLNINLPMNYWGAEPAGVGEAHLALLPQLEAMARRGADTARRLYGADGWVAHHNSDVWAYTLPTGGDASWSQWALGGAWLVCQFDEHRRFGSMDDAVARRFWPVVEGCAAFLLDWLVDDGSGLTTAPSTSPENQFRRAERITSVTCGSALDRALIRDVFALVGELADELGIDSDVARRAAAARGRVAGPRVGADGAVAEWGRDEVAVDPRHRHVSHLYPWYPGRLESAHLGDAVARTLDARGDDSTGWSLAWKIGLRARLHDGAAVGRLLDLVGRPAADAQQRGGLYPNLFAAHPPFQIDGNLGLVGAFLEALVQSHRPGRIDLLPALPPGLARGSVRGLIARPGVVVDLAWEDRRPTTLRVVARTPGGVGPLLLTHGDRELTVELRDGSPVDLTWPI